MIITIIWGLLGAMSLALVIVMALIFVSILRAWWEEKKQCHE